MLVAKEGKIFVYPLIFITILCFLIQLIYDISILLSILVGLVVIFCINFFRDPKRVLPEGNNFIVSPADGKIIRLEIIDDDELGKCRIVSIFLNVFNVHVNRMPMKGVFKDVEYTKGKFLMAFNHRACDLNERNSISIMTEIGMIKVIQIAGLLARRIICYAKKKETMDIGGRLGFMRFGSRIDLILPVSVQLKIVLNQKVIGNKTIIGTFKS